LRNLPLDLTRDRHPRMPLASGALFDFLLRLVISFRLLTFVFGLA